MDFIYYIPIAVLFLWITLRGILKLVLIIKSGSIRRPEFSRKNMKLMLEKSFPPSQQEAVLAELDRYRMQLPAVVNRTAAIVKTPGKEDVIIQQLNPATDNTEPLLAQIQMSILKIAHGDINVIKKYAEFPEKFDYRDIIFKAGYA